ncbi:uncharacterized protein N7496_002926 [Penicillium cataractarum]|uniref:Uncharacterized protein n=1 Tax=Penicillium cataractarum TaxID=2100454 RepID=A0A9W9VFP6_9EURO|nr:uncharacterized protein N7496_002926 [Penicillium cataractarum]KAJ5380498.1 hypothetical protein N7496_002926 [Penicillium cataractarum]
MADNGDRVMCHACGGVWLLETGEDGHDTNLRCPHCESDATEIIEIPPKPLRQNSKQNRIRRQ